MPDLQALRKKNLKALIKQWDGPTNLAKKLGYSGPSYLSQLVGSQKPITEKTARYVESTLDLPPGWLDLDQHPDRQGKAERVNSSLVARVMLTVGAAVEDAGLKLSPGRMADLVAFAYEHAVVDGAVDDECIRKLVKLLKG
jgi:hypothetical protein